MREELQERVQQSGTKQSTASTCKRGITLVMQQNESWPVKEKCKRRWRRQHFSLILLFVPGACDGVSSRLAVPPCARLCSSTRQRQPENQSSAGSLAIKMHQAAMQDAAGEINVTHQTFRTHSKKGRGSSVSPAAAHDTSGDFKSSLNLSKLTENRVQPLQVICSLHCKKYWCYFAGRWLPDKKRVPQPPPLQSKIPHEK